MSDIVERLKRSVELHIAWDQYELGKPVAPDPLRAGDTISLLGDAIAEIERLRSLVEWRPIETAPKDGTEILAASIPSSTGTMLVRYIALQDFITTSEAEDYANQGMSESSLEEPDWFHADFVHGDRLSPDCYPTHWLPLPAPPEPKP